MAKTKSTKVTKAMLKAMAEGCGLPLSDERIEHLLPLMQAIADSMAKLDEMDLKDTPPAFIFPMRAD